MKFLSLTRMVPVAVSFSLALVTTAVADINTAMAEFKSCVEENLDAERAKDKPKVNSLLKKCSRTYRAMRHEIPEELRHQVDDHVKRDIKELLSES